MERRDGEQRVTARSRIDHQRRSWWLGWPRPTLSKRRTVWMSRTSSSGSTASAASETSQSSRRQVALVDLVT